MEGQIIEKLINMLQLDQTQNLMIVFDAFGYKNADLVAEGMTDRQFPFCARFIPFTTQLQYSKQQSLPECLAENIKHSEAFIFFCSDHERCTRFRSSVLALAVENNCKILHLPGVDDKLFASTINGIELNGLGKRATALKRQVKSAKKIEVLTHSKTNGDMAPHRLEIILQGREVKCDIGIASPGEIAQLPPGEIYTAPKEYVASGSLVVNGSAPERVFHNDHFPVLTFEEGRVLLEKSYFPRSVTGKGFRQDLINSANENPLNLVLGELGIGINRQIKIFTGKPIHDEKADGTMHIALGSNVVFGGEIESDNHIDLIFIPDQVLVDGEDLGCKWGIGLKKEAR
jgi:hypothetical protein